jgi:chromosome segregation ATPase
MVACNSNQKEYENLQARFDSLLSIGFTKDTALYSYIESFNRIQANLDSIKQAEMLISQNTAGNMELQPNQKEQINRDINMIYEMLQRNKKTIADLKSKIKRSNGKLTELEVMIERMAQQVDEKDSQINQLTSQLEKMNIQIEILYTDIDNLTTDNDTKTQTIEEQAKTINTAYYVVGTKKELFENNIITREGGFIGIGTSKTLKKDFNRDYFTSTDINKLKSLPLLKRKATVITTHPSQSYKIYGDRLGDSLVISNPHDFWSVSKYLVIILD